MKEGKRGLQKEKEQEGGGGGGGGDEEEPDLADKKTARGKERPRVCAMEDFFLQRALLLC